MTPLERTLAKALTEVVIKLDHSDNDDITPEATIKVLEPVVALLQGPLQAGPASPCRPDPPVLAAGNRP
ncbi:hypothetical protein [Nonomuraea diastatica]|uniref:Uncharacterized protein n=1 Tax=Nonomuraea diastatica TaxID=1848329 RepID=A0A4R4WU61_9ACTN|nr:hypothetical protein [Nonomuraea diastatica]TDD21229.1 hypothetical protein E1294_15390 [Nonomuraea diastatica]